MAQSDRIDEALEATATANFNTTATEAARAIITGMSITPPAGTYLAIFSCRSMNTNGTNTYSYGIYNNGTLVAHSLRQITPGGNQFSDAYLSQHTIAKVTVNGAQTVDVRIGSSGGTQNVNERSLYLVRIDQ